MGSSLQLYTKIALIVVFQQTFSCRFAPAVGIFLASQWLVDVPRLIREVLLTGIDGKGYDS
jgi:hypothetical protein